MGKKAPASLTPPLSDDLKMKIAFIIEYIDPVSPHHSNPSMPKAAEEAAAAIADYAGGCSNNRDDLAKAGAIEPLVQLCQGTLHAGPREQSTRALRFLSFNNPFCYQSGKAYQPQFQSFDNVTAIVNANGIPPLVAAVKSGSPVQRENAATALSQLGNIRPHRTAIAAAGALPALIQLVSEGSSSTDEGLAMAARQAAVALGSLSFHHGENVTVIKTLGGEKLLQSLVNNTSTPRAMKSVCEYTLANINADPELLKPPPPPEDKPKKKKK